MTELRKGTAADIPSAAHIICETWKVAYKGIVPDSDIVKYTNEDTKSDTLRKMVSEGLSFFVASVNGRDCGVCSYSRYDKPNFSDCAYIMQLYIHPDFQRVGIGSLLMQRVCDEVELLGYKRIVLNTLEKNHKARAFYEKKGFEFFGTEDSPLFSERVVRALYKKEL